VEEYVAQVEVIGQRRVDVWMIMIMIMIMVGNKKLGSKAGFVPSVGVGCLRT
jgi:hypothetical protein